MDDIVNLNFKNKKQWLKAVVLGFLIGLAVILPGISGATIAIIFGLYSKMIYSFGNIFKQFKKCVLFLLPIGIGLVFGFVVGFFFVQRVFEAQPFIVVCLFAGLMIGSFPAVKDETKGVKWNKKSISLFIVGVLIPVAIGIVSILIQSSPSTPIELSPMIMVSYFVIGLIVSITQIVPGLSCSALLMAFGQFGSIMASIHFEYIKGNPLVLLPLLMLALGFVIGVVVFSKFLNKLLEKKRNVVFTIIVGLSLGSIASMFLNPDIYAVYSAWASVGVIFKNLIIGAVLLAIGYVIAYLLVRYKRKMDAEANNEKLVNVVSENTTENKQNN